MDGLACRSGPVYGSGKFKRMQETSLHFSLKEWYTQAGDRQEVPVDGFLVDVVSGGLLIEIQTRSFSKIKPKLTSLLERHPIRLVHPIAKEKWIVRMPAEGEQPIDRRKSPKRGRLEDLFIELVRIPHLINHPNLSLEVLLTREEEVRRDDGRGSWRRKGWSIADRRLIEVLERFTLAAPNDFHVFLPSSLPQPFTSKDLALALKIPAYLARKISYCLRVMEVIDIDGKQSRAWLYSTRQK